jgi:formylglycine-generating enzyme required for sulfatase activity
MKTALFLAMLAHVAVCPCLLGADVVFADGFESGSVELWSAAVGVVVVVSLPGGVPIELVRVPAGTFVMGCSPPEEGCWNEFDQPAHQVTLTQPFYIGRYEITQGQWLDLMGHLPLNNDEGPNYPVTRVTWDNWDIKDPQHTAEPGFFEVLNQHLVSTGQFGAGLFRLPTEAEWEYATRAGTTTRFYFGDAPGCAQGYHDYECPAALPYMWWGGNATDIQPVGSKLPNQFGLYDMHGNVSEWVLDASEPYPSDPQIDPFVDGESTHHRPIRSGDWFTPPWYCRSASRQSGGPGDFGNNLGFRVVMSERILPP